MSYDNRINEYALCYSIFPSNANIIVGDISVDQFIRVVVTEFIAQPRHVLLPVRFAENLFRRAPNVSWLGTFSTQINADAEVIHVRVDVVLAFADASRQHGNPLAEAEQDAAVTTIADK